MRKLWNGWKVSVTGLALLGMMLPLHPLSAAGTGQPQRNLGLESASVVDVALGPGGTLRGQLVAQEGQRVAGAPVEIWRSGTLVGATHTGADGSFEFHELGGGVYQLVSDGAVHSYRCWAANTAPPAAADSVLLVEGDVERGQRPLGKVLTHPLVLGLIIAAAIAIPIAVHRSRDKPPAS